MNVSLSVPTPSRSRLEKNLSRNHWHLAEQHSLEEMAPVRGRRGHRLENLQETEKSTSQFQFLPVPRPNEK